MSVIGSGRVRTKKCNVCQMYYEVFSGSTCKECKEVVANIHSIHSVGRSREVPDGHEERIAKMCVLAELELPLKE